MTTLRKALFSCFVNIECIPLLHTNTPHTATTESHTAGHPQGQNDPRVSAIIPSSPPDDFAGYFFAFRMYLSPPSRTNKTGKGNQTGRKANDGQARRKIHLSLCFPTSFPTHDNDHRARRITSTITNNTYPSSFFLIFFLSLVLSVEGGPRYRASSEGK